MDYDFGDIIDCRNAPVGHFILVVGTTHNGKVMYFIITSRVYAVFEKILEFFNDCVSNNHRRFFHHFSKERGKTRISFHGRLCDAVFLDKKSNYNLFLDEDSMLVINSDPSIFDKSALDALRQEGKIRHSCRLAEIDMIRIKETVKRSQNISANMKNQIARNYNFVKRSTH